MDETGGKQEGKRRHKTRPWTLKGSEVLYKKKNQSIVVVGGEAGIQNKPKRA